jgi:hypothetical protein
MPIPKEPPAILVIIPPITAPAMIFEPANVPRRIIH